MGLALYRRYEPGERLIESFISPDRLHAWRTARAGEVDFVAGPRRESMSSRSSTGARSTCAAQRASQAHPGRPAVIATQEDLLFADGYTLLPAHTLLWALG